jgi:hypothetical protein
MNADYPAPKRHDVIWVTQLSDAIAFFDEIDLPC